MCLTQKGSQLFENVRLTFILQCMLSKNDTKKLTRFILVGLFVVSVLSGQLYSHHLQTL